MGKLSGKNALVTGGASGLGKAFCLRLAELGANVAVVDTSVPDKIRDEISAKGVKVCKAEGDIADPLFVADAVKAAAQEIGEISVLVCNSDDFGYDLDAQKASTADLSNFDAFFNKNVKGMMIAVQAVVPMMKENHYGKIVTVSSHLGIEALDNGGNAPYGAAMAAIRNYTLAASAELGPYGITVNTIAPGWIELEPDQFKGSQKDDCIAMVSLERLGTPDDCTGVLEFLVTDLSGFVTGNIVEVTGGTTFKQ